MTQTIITRYHGPGNVRGSRYSATTSSGKRRWMSIDHAENDETNHHRAAQRLAETLNWPGKWQGGALNDKGAMIWVNTSDNFAPNYRFEV